MPQKQNKVSQGAKKFWNAISTGWVVEYPGQGGPPRDFFDRRDRTPQGVRRARENEERGLERGSERGGDEVDDSDKIFRWKEQQEAARRG